MKLYLIFFTIFCTFSLVAQNTHFTIGTTTANEGASTIVKGPNGDYYIGGYSDNKALVTRTSNNGVPIWTKTLSFGSDPDYVFELDITSDNFLIGVGNSRTSGSHNAYGFAFKMDLNGSLIWHKKFNCNNNYMWANGIKEVGNGNYTVVGSFVDNKQDSYALELDYTTGNAAWDSIYAKSPFGNSFDESFLDIEMHSTNKAKYIVGRMQKSGGQGTYRPSLTKIDSNGVYQWTKTYLYNSSSSGGRLYSFSIDQDGDSLILGTLGKVGGTGTPFEVGLIKTDTAGNIGWAKMYSSTINEDLRSYNIVNTPNGYIISGWRQSGNKELFLIKTDKQGTVLWSNLYGDSADESVHVPSSNGRVIIDNNNIVTVGRTNSFGTNYDIFLVKADINSGQLSSANCFDSLALTTSILPAFQENYPMIRSTLPISFSVPAITPISVLLDYSGNLIESVTDTIVSNDTIFLCAGDQIDVTADWSSNLSYLWNTGSTSQTETLTNQGIYWVDISGTGGCLLWSDTVYVVVDSLQVNIINDTTVCGNNPIILDAFIQGATYIWQDNSVSSSFTTDTSGLFIVNIIDGNCQYTDSAEISYLSQPSLDLGNDTIICSADSTITLNAQNNGLNYLWNNGDTTQTTVANISDSYWVIVSNGVCSDTDTVTISFVIESFNFGPDTTICSSDSIVLSVGNSNNNIFWNTGSTSSSILIDTSGTYWAEVSNGTCFYSDSIQINVVPAPTLELGLDTSLCAPPLILYGQNNGASYLWSNGSTTQNISVSQTGTYWVTVSYGSCLVFDTIDIEFSQPIVNLGNDITICQDELLVLSAANSGSTYLWNNGSTNQTLSIMQSGTYWVMVSDPNGCFNSDTIEISIQEIAANYNVDFGSDCAPVQSVFTDLSTVNFGAIANWQWQFGDNNSSSEVNPSHTYIQDGSFLTDLTVTSSIGCTSSFSSPAVIDVHPNSVANFAVTPTIGVANQLMTFTNLSSNYTYWNWHFGDQQNSTELHPTHIYEREGVYQVELVVNNEYDCADTVELTILVNDELLIYAPNVFTPDQNINNQDWKIHITGIDTYQFKVTIFDRWGEIIWISYDPDKSWNGNYNGELVQNGVYVWKLDYTQASSSQNKTIFGTVTVLK